MTKYHSMALPEKRRCQAFKTSSDAEFATDYRFAFKENSECDRSDGAKMEEGTEEGTDREEETDREEQTDRW